MNWNRISKMTVRLTLFLLVAISLAYVFLPLPIEITGLFQTNRWINLAVVAPLWAAAIAFFAGRVNFKDNDASLIVSLIGNFILGLASLLALLLFEANTVGESVPWLLGIYGLSLLLFSLQAFITKAIATAATLGYSLAVAVLFGIAYGFIVWATFGLLVLLVAGLKLIFGILFSPKFFFARFWAWITAQDIE